MAELDPEVLKQTLSDILRSSAQNSAPTTSQSSVDPGLTAALNSVVGSLNKLVETLGNKVFNTQGLELGNIPQVATAINGLGNASTAASKAIYDLAQKFPGLGSAFAGLAKDFKSVIDTTFAARQAGIGQGNFGEATGQAMRGGFDNLDDRLKWLGENFNNGLRVTGKTADIANQRLLDLSEKTIGTEMGQNLINNGLVSARQLAEISQLAAAGNRDALKTEEGRQKLAFDTAQMASQMQTLAEITGVSVSQQIRELQEIKNTANQQMAETVLANDLQRQTLTAVQALGPGKTFKEIEARIMAGGRLTKDQQRYLTIATGGRGGEYIAALKEVQATAQLDKTDKRRIAAEEELARQRGLIASEENVKRVSQIGITSANANTVAAAQTFTKEVGQLAGAVGAKQRESGLTGPEALKTLQGGEGQAAQRGERQEGSLLQGPMKNYAQEFFKPFYETSEGARKNTAALAGELGKLTVELGKSTTAVELLRSAGQPFGGAGSQRGQTQEEANQMMQNVFTPRARTALGPLLGKPEEGKGTAPGVSRDGLGRPIVNTDQTTLNSNNTVINTPPVKTPETPTATPASPTGPDVRLRGKGTLGETGSPLETVDGWRYTHKGETTATPEQIANLMQNSKTNAINEMLSGLKSATEGKTVQNKEFNLETVFEKFNTTISSVLSSTGKITENPAEKTETTKSTSSTDDIQKLIPKSEIKDTVKTDMPLRLDEMFTTVKDTFGKFQPEINLSEIIKAERLTAPNIVEEFSNFFKLAKPELPTEEAVETEPTDKKFETLETMSIKDLHDQLIQLNTGIRQLVANSAESVKLTDKQIGVTKKLSGNRFA